MVGFRAAGGGENKKPSVPKCSEGISENLSGKLYSSLAVFYVEQVALNRHVRCNSSFLIYGAKAGDCQEGIPDANAQASYGNASAALPSFMASDVGQ
jgi:hypothetical protein